MSRLQALHPDQQAVLQLVLRRRMPYGDLAGLLGLTPEGVRERALDAVDGLAPDDVPGLALEDRDRIADHLLGQDEGAAREATAALLAEHPPAHVWASTVAVELEPLGGPVAPLPGPESAAAVASPDPILHPGPAVAAEPEPVAELEPPVEPVAAPSPSVAPTVAASAGPASGGDVGSAFAAIGTKGGAGRASNPFASRSPRLLAGSAAALVVLVLLVIWIAGGFSGSDDKSDPSASSPAATTTAAGTSTDATAAAQADAASFVSALPQSISFRPPASATGVFAKVSGTAQPTVSPQDATVPVLALSISNLPAATSSRRYFVWADKNGADPIFLGPLPSVQGAAVPFQGIDLKTRQATAVDPSVYTTVRVTREGAKAPTKPGPTVIVGRISPRS